MYIKMNYKILIIFLAFLTYNTGQVLICQDGATATDDNLCECKDDLFYNAYEGKCQDICTFYGNTLCGYDEYQLCVNDPNSPSNFACNCQPGFNESDSCQDNNECLNTTICSSNVNEECLNLFGTFACKCKDDYYRSNTSGICEEVDKCNLPGEKSCEQVCTSSSTGQCICFSGFEMKAGRCEPSSGYARCECTPLDPSRSSCVNDTQQQYCYPNPGYDNETGSIQDINECEKDYECTINSHCVNRIGEYGCDCNSGYYYNKTLQECRKIECPASFSLVNYECKELCGLELGPQCPYDTLCVVDYQNIPLCDCQLVCQSKANRNKTFIAYTLIFRMPHDDFYASGIKPHDLYRTTRSLGSIFGKGNVQLTNYTKGSPSGTTIAMAISVNETLKAGALALLVQDKCRKINSLSSQDLCVLPEGVVVAVDSIKSEKLYPCRTFPSLCPNMSTTCFDNSNSSIPEGSYECRCKSGFEIAEELSEVYCVDINECMQNKNLCSNGYVCSNFPGSYQCVFNSTSGIQKELDDQIQKTKVVGGVLGAFFALSAVLLLIAIFYIFKMRS